MGFACSGAPEPSGVILIICYLIISSTTDILIVKEFRIFTKSTIFNNLQSIA
jgi:hypothetical protein